MTTIASFRNNKAAFLWGLALFFTLFTAAMTWLVVRDGSPEGYSPLLVTGVLACFWLAALALLAHVGRNPCFSATLQADGRILLVWRYPLRSVRRELQRSELDPARVIADEDDEGVPYFRVRLDLPGGAVFDLYESHARKLCEERCRRFNRLLTAPSEPSP